MSLRLKDKVAIGITTFLRDNCLYYCVDRIQRFYPQLKMYIVDQGNMTDEKKYFYRHLRKKGHKIIKIDFDSGISTSRKVLKDAVKEPYLLYVEDDFILHKYTNIENMVKILDSDDNIDIVGGQVCSTVNFSEYARFEYMIFRVANRLMYMPCSFLLRNGILKWYHVDDIHYHYADIVSDFTLWRREVPNIFDINVKVIEHSHSYLLLKETTKSKVAFTPDASVFHSHDRVNLDYRKFRSRMNDVQYFYKYWNVTEDNVYLDKCLPSIFRVDDDNYHTKDYEKLVSEYKQNPADEIEHKIVIMAPISEAEDKNESFLKLLNHEQIYFWLLKDSCVLCITHKNLIKDNLQIGVKTFLDKARILQINQQYNINLDISIEPQRQTKEHKYMNIPIRVPMPVIEYVSHYMKSKS